MIKRDLNLTDYQYAGLLLESATFLALENLGIQPKALHNPHDNDYAKDQHLSIDLIFIHDKKLYGVECKNLGHSSHVNLEFIQREIIDRFNYTKIFFDRKILVFGTCHCNKVSIPDEYSVIVLGYKVNFENQKETIEILTELLGQHIDSMEKVSRVNPKSSSNNLIDCNNRLEYLHGYNTYNSKRKKLHRIDSKLRKKWNKLIYQGNVLHLDSMNNLDGWVCPYCELAFMDEKKLNHHIKNKHPKEWIE